jgi:hypothetical protein
VAGPGDNLATLAAEILKIEAQITNAPKGRGLGLTRHQGEKKKTEATQKKFSTAHVMIPPRQ